MCAKMKLVRPCSGVHRREHRAGRAVLSRVPLRLRAKRDLGPGAEVDPRTAARILRTRQSSSRNTEGEQVFYQSHGPDQKSYEPLVTREGDCRSRRILEGKSRSVPRCRSRWIMSKPQAKRIHTVATLAWGEPSIRVRDPRSSERRRPW